LSVAVLIPWRSTDCPHRSRALAFVLSRYATTGWPVVIGRHDDGPWCKALAVDDALAQTQAEILILGDADCWTSGLPAAVQAVQDGAAWAIPHRAVHRLNEAATARYMAGSPLEGLPLGERAYLGVEGGGLAVVRRDAYEAAPLDQRFTGWGSEDDAAGLAWRCLHGPPWRGKAPLIHLYHPPQERATRTFGSMESRDLRKRYARARHDPAAMQRLIEEGRPCLSPRS
jgi:hypothetical protein